jgi:hypothetical protein
MTTLKEDINWSIDWLIKAFKTINITLDFSINSIQNIENFLDEQLKNNKSKKHNLLSENYGGKLFAISSYIGEVIIRNTNNSYWVVNDNDPEGEINIEINSKNGIKIYPAQKVIQRINNGKIDNLYFYVSEIIKVINS